MTFQMDLSHQNKSFEIIINYKLLDNITYFWKSIVIYG